MRTWLQWLMIGAALEPALPVARSVLPAHVQPAGVVTRRFVLSEQARRFLILQYRNYSTEFMGCMIGEVRDSVAYVERIAPADVDPYHSTATTVTVASQTSCEDAGWTGTIGRIHSHPSGQKCSYYMPATEVLNSDGQSFLRSAYPVDAIMCGDRVVWIAREMIERQIAMVPTGTGGSVGGSP
ncbi:MAG TPA: hypothetical protein VIW26_07365 [Gemmatimonadales bacterium]